MKNAVKAKPLNDAQLMVLQVITGEYDETEIGELRQLLLDFNSRKMQQHLDETVLQKGYEKADFKNMLTSHSRKVH